MINILEGIEDSSVGTGTGPALPVRFREATYGTGQLVRGPRVHGRPARLRDVVFTQVPRSGVENRAIGYTYFIFVPMTPRGKVDLQAIYRSGSTAYRDTNTLWKQCIFVNEPMVARALTIHSLVYPQTHSTTDPEGHVHQSTQDGITLSDPLEGYENYAVEDWDGYDAFPITAETLDAARSILRSLPDTFGDPVCSPGADGSIVFEWLKDDGPLRKLFIDIGPGKTWKAYWRLASGETGTILRKRLTMRTILELRSLFEKLLHG